MNLLIKIICFLVPMKLIQFFVKNKYTKLHPFPVTSLIHRGSGTVLFEIEFNWYDKDLLPVSLVREVKSGKQYSISYYEILEFKEYLGRDRSAGTSIGSYGKES